MQIARGEERSPAVPPGGRSRRISGMTRLQLLAYMTHESTVITVKERLLYTYIEKESENVVIGEKNIDRIKAPLSWPRIDTFWSLSN